MSRRLRRAFVFSLLMAGAPAFADDEMPRGVRWGAVPIGNVSSDRGLEVGVLGQRFDYGPDGTRPFVSLWTLQASYATRGPRLLYLEREATGLGASGRGRWLARVYFQESDFQPYFGVPYGASLAAPAGSPDRFRFASRDLVILQALRGPAGGGWEWLAGLALQASRQAPLPGASRYREDFGDAARAGVYPSAVAQLIQERRDSEFIPTRGHYSRAGLGAAAGSGVSDGAWWRGDLEHRRHWPLLPGRRLTLAAQARYAFSTGGAPLAERVRLGSFGTLRGLPLGRYLGNHTVGLRTEARSIFVRTRVFDLPLKGGLGLFLDSGRIADRPADLIDARTHVGYGVSFIGSYFTDDFLGTLDVGFAEGGWAFYMRLGHAF
jgi:hypothetical protein